MFNKRITLVIMMIAVFTLFTACSGSNTDMKKNTGSSGDTMSENSVKDENGLETEEKSEISFPYELDNGNLVVNSLFSSSIENPDCENEYEEDIASLEVVNQSGRFLESADITLHMSDGKEMHMVINDLPAGQKIWVFDDKNNSVTGETACVSVDCTAEYMDKSPMMEDDISVETDEITVTLENRSEEILDGLTVMCHCSIDGVYYGGLTYSYPVDKLSPGESTDIEADDCFLGTADVVRISK